MSDRPQMIHNTWDDGRRFRCSCGWSSVFMEDETDRIIAIAQRQGHDIINNNKPGDSDGEAAHAALAGFWHTYPLANADMSMRVTRAIRNARLQERERCVALVKDWIEDFGPAIPDRSVDSLKAILHDIENSE